MSFGFGAGGFGQNNNNQQQQQQQTTGFGGFGATNTTTPAFGSNTTNTGFGANNNNTSGGLFGNTSGGFGNTGGFGATNTNTGFGAAKPAFGAPAAGGGLFGPTPATTQASSGFGGGFGANNNTTSSPFGGTTAGSLFGQKPAATTGFGASPATTGFGAPAPATTGFGGFGNTNATTIGGATGECQGTGSVAFQATQEKEPNSTTNQQNAFQSISFQQPYQKFSPEELRLVDYAQGRRYGNGTAGATGAFGASNFGGFGSTNTNNNAFGAANTTNNNTGGLFGNNNTATTTPFGQAATTTGGFGAGAAAGGLFGQNKPATGGLFGNNNATPPATGGLFGSAPAATGFGATSAANTGFGAPAGNGLFGNNNAAKPAGTGFSFGQAAAPATTGFGQAAAPTTGFGAPASGGLFGNNNAQAQPAASNPFGGATTQPAAGGLFGNTGAFGSNNTQQPAAGGGLFGGAAKPATGGLFGSNTATNNNTGGLFGNGQANTSSPFGAAQNNTGGLFGQAKPAAAGGTSLFGGAQPQNNGTQGGLFGGSTFGNNNQGQTQQGAGGLFGSLNNNNNNTQTQSGGLFGQPQQAGNSLFGGNNQQQGNSLFGGSTNQQQQPQMGQSIFGNSQAAQQQGLTASINDPAAFGTSLFSNLGSAQVIDPGPIATPLSSLSKQKKPGVLPMYKLNPASSASRFNTPNSRRGGFGFSYSTYGTPGSVSSNLSNTPLNMSGSVLGSSMSGNRLTQSMSSSNMRNSIGSFGREDSILAPGAFSASPGRSNGTGSMKKLVINRGIRTDLFSPPAKDNSLASTGSPNNQQSILKKRVSFEPNAQGGNLQMTQGSSPLKETTAAPSATELGYLRSSPRTETPQTIRSAKPVGQSAGNGSHAEEHQTSPDMQQVKGNELAIVSEKSSTATETPTKAGLYNKSDKESGEYWMLPCREDIEKMNRVQRQKVSNFKIGRRGVGQVNFLVPVDLTTINLDELFGKDVLLEVRSATVYPNKSTKPPMGKGLNVPSRIELENSWPRVKDRRPVGNKESQAKLKKHIDRLSRVEGTNFVDYDKDNGIWTFEVEHFTRYGIDYSDDDEVQGDTDFEESVLSAPPDTPTPASRTPKSFRPEESFSTNESDFEESSPEDTFNFRRKKILPGAFDNQEAFVEDEDEEMDEHSEHSFLDERSMGSQSDDDIEEAMDRNDAFHDRELVRIEDGMTGAYPNPGNTIELASDHPVDHERSDMAVDTPGAVQRARARAQKAADTPSKRLIQLDDDNWTNMLQKTISPRKQDRGHLRKVAELALDESLPDLDEAPVSSNIRSRSVSGGQGFTTSIDLMRSLYGEATKSPAKSAKIAHKPKGFQWPYQKGNKNVSRDMSEMSTNDKAWHESMKPSWGPKGTLVYAASGSARDLTKSSRRRVKERDGLLVVQNTSVVSEARDVKFASFSNESTAEPLKKQKSLTAITVNVDVPEANIPQPFSLKDFFSPPATLDPASSHEKLVWELASILFDDIKIAENLATYPNAIGRLRKDSLSTFWQHLVGPASTRDAAMAKSSEEKAIACLSGHKIADACKNLLDGKDFHLATLVALIGQNETTRKDIHIQLLEWKNSKMLSEISQPVRTLYELLAGNVSVCDGTKQGPLEDRMESYIISQRHGLDWRQAFGLRLWYALSSSDGLEVAVQRFAEDLSNDKEYAKPRAWYVEQGIPPIWNDDALDSREDLLWGLLKLFGNPDSDLEAILRPENSQLSPLDVRLSWQLSRALTAFDKAAYGTEDAEKTDALTLDFASQLTSEGNWLDATFVLIHLTSSVARAKAIQEHLAHHASEIGSEESKAFQTLKDDLQIPVEWIWEAKALYARSVLEAPVKETECLLKAASYTEAHRTFIKTVAPQAVIERDLDSLRSLLQGFQGRELGIKDWHLGGEVYSDYLKLLDSQKKGTVAQNHDIIDRLFASLPAMATQARGIGFMENVAVQEISGVLSKIVVGMGRELKGDKNTSRVLGLPLMEDKQLKHTAELSLTYFKGVMAGGR